MKNAILLHGLQNKDEYYDQTFPAPGNAHWFPWLQKQLLTKGFYTETPNVPEVYQATYEEWKETFERCHHVDEETILVGHSCGGGFLMRWISENKDKKVGKVVLVAPWTDPSGGLTGRMEELFKFDLDEELVTRTKGFTVFSSDNDQDSVKQTVSILKNKVKNLKVVEFHNYGHFCYSDMNTEEFPELLKECLS